MGAARVSQPLHSEWGVRRTWGTWGSTSGGLSCAFMKNHSAHCTFSHELNRPTFTFPILQHLKERGTKFPCMEGTLDHGSAPLGPPLSCCLSLLWHVCLQQNKVFFQYRDSSRQVMWRHGRVYDLTFTTRDSHIAPQPEGDTSMYTDMCDFCQTPRCQNMTFHYLGSDCSEGGWSASASCAQLGQNSQTTSGFSSCAGALRVHHHICITDRPFGKTFEEITDSAITTLLGMMWCMQPGRGFMVAEFIFTHR